MTWDTEAFRTEFEGWLEVAPAEEDPQALVACIVAELESTPQQSPRRGVADINRLVMLGAAAILVIIAVMAVVAMPAGWPSIGPGHGASPEATPTHRPDTLEPSEAIWGIPAPGAQPNDPSSTELVLSLDSNINDAGTTLRVYADGRVLWLRWIYPGMTQVGNGVFQQRVTPAGIDYLRDLALDTGLFEHDLVLRRESLFFDLTLRDEAGDTRVAWARVADWGLGAGRDPTPAEAEAMTSLEERLSRSHEWPGWVWADATERPYVPVASAICLRSVPLATSLADLRDALPDAVDEFLRSADRSTREESARDGCIRLGTDDVHRLVELLDAARVERSGETRPQPWLRYTFADTTVPGNTIWIRFDTVLPDGELMLLGPG